MRLAIQARLTSFFLFAGVLCLAAGKVQAQVDTGAITGHISDSSGSLVPKASVSAREENTGIVSRVTADAHGNYTFSPLKLGVYTITAAKEGFKQTTRGHIEVTIQSRIEVDEVLQIGDVSETVDVTSASPVLETQSSSIQQLVDARAIDDLPLNGRNATFLAQLSPGVTFAQADSRGLQQSGSFAANGARRTQNNYLLDGMDNNSQIADLVNQTQFVVMPPPDALREFTVQTSNYSAEFGHSAGAVLNISTKSGSNKLHGVLWEYLRNDMFDARDYFAKVGTVEKPEYRQNQFGGTLGGPIVIPHVYDGHDRTFFFVDYQGTRIVQSKIQKPTVPSVLERDSNFTDLTDLITRQSGTPRVDALGRSFRPGTVMDPATTRPVTNGARDSVTGLNATSTGYVRDPFYSGSLLGVTNFTTQANAAMLNHIDPSRINVTAVNLLKLFTPPTAEGGTGVVGNGTFAPKHSITSNSMDTRLDEQLGNRDSLFFRYSYVNSQQFYPPLYAGYGDGGASRPGNGFTISQNGALGWTHILTQHLVNEARIGYSRIYDLRKQNFADTMGIPGFFGIPGIPQLPGNGGLPTIQFGQLANLGSANTLPSDKASDVTQGTENLSIDRGRHQIRVGVEVQHIAFPFLAPTQSRGNFAFTGTYTSVVSNNDVSTDRAQFILQPVKSPYGAQFDYLGGANTLSATNFPASFYPERNYYGAYLQDSWRVFSNLTLNLGVRYEFLGVPSERNGRIGNFIPAAAGESQDGQSHYYIPQQHIGELPQDFLDLMVANGILVTPMNSNAIGRARPADFAPRLGFAWQPQPGTSVRGGYGLFYQGNENHGASLSPYINFPFQVSSAYSGGSPVQAIIADKVHDTTPEGTVGPIWEGLQNVPLTPDTVSVSSLGFQGEPINPKTTYSQAFNLQVQQLIGPQTIMFLGFVGSNVRHAQTSIGTNAVNTITPPTTNTQSIAFFKTINVGGNYIEHDGKVNYNSMQAGVERRFNRGLAFLANITWSRCEGDAKDLLDNDIGGYRAPYVPGIGIKADTEPCDTDHRLIFHAAGTWQLPFGKGQRWLTHGLPAFLIGGWSTNWIIAAQTGTPLTIPCSTSTASGLGCNAIKLSNVNPYAGRGPHNILNFLNQAAFVNPPAVQVGQTGSIVNLGGPGAQVYGPPYRRVDFSIFRRFNLPREKSYLQFRAEAFNLTNTPNFAQPGSLDFTTSSSFGVITSTRNNPDDEREIQLSMKLYF